MHNIFLYFIKLISVITIVLAVAAPSQAQEDERKLGSQLESNIQEGQPLWLNNGANPFFSIFIGDQSGIPKGAVILLHDADTHPDWPEVIHPLRTYLPLHGWATLSIQLPQLAANEDYKKVQNIMHARISKAAEHLRTIGFKNIAIVGHGTGAMTSTTFLASTQNHDIRGFVAISLEVLQSPRDKDSIPKQLEKLALPMLDIYGSLDYPRVTHTAKTRAIAAKKTGERNNSEGYTRSMVATIAKSNVAGYIAFRQVAIQGADHNFTGLQDLLSKRVLGWLDRHTKGIAVTSDI